MRLVGLCAVVALAAALACGSSARVTVDASVVDGGSSCAVAHGCPDAGAPSYRSAIVPILENTCIGCHRQGGPAGYPETTYAEVAAQASPMLDQVAGCVMPPATAPDGTPVPQLSLVERETLTAWLECGAPDN
jgi:hypothetical protein